MTKDKTKDWHKVKEQSDKEEMIEEQAKMEEEEATHNNEAALDHPSYAALEEKLTLMEQKAHENWEKAVRAMAEADNARRRATLDIEKAHKFGLEKLINSFLPVVDSLEQAIELSKNDENSSMREGLLLTLKLFLDALEKLDVVQLNPEGEAFNPQEHEAMSMQEVAGVAPNTVIAVFQKGYKLNDRVIRPARVIVTKP
ncbi:MAG: nucleotide exchange factor GrpE [Proteobacteria bacterium]|nr:nucleotide exchange factor GrpE [Pseudomonadota bacterium]